jgi:hypothetical protein
MGFVRNFLDDVVGLDPNGGGVYSVARDVVGDKIADDILGMDPNGGGAIKFYNTAIPLAAGAYGLDALGAFDGLSGAGELASGGANAGTLSAEELAGLGADASSVASINISTVGVPTAEELAGLGVDAGTQLTAEELAGLGADTGVTTTGAIAPGGIEVVDLAGTAVPGAGAGTAAPSLLKGAGDLIGAIGSTLGPAGLAAGALGAGALLGGGGGGSTTATTQPTTGTSTGSTRSSLPMPNLNFGLNPGQVTVQPYYQNAAPGQNQYYWGLNRPLAQTQADLASWNNIAGAPTTPFGAAQPIAPLDINEFIKNTINPNWQAALAGSNPALYAPQSMGTSVAPTVLPGK